MATYVSWTTPVAHPYLTRPTLKRKLSYYSYGDSSSEPSPASATSDLPSFPPQLTINSVNAANPPDIDETPNHATKRRRFDMLQQDFEHLSLEQIKEREREMAAREREKKLYMDQEQELRERLWERDGEVDMYDDSDVIRPSSVESPPDPPAKPLASGDGWYEPEKDRIVITSLDSDSDTSEPSIPQTPGFLSPPEDRVLVMKNDALVSKVMLKVLKESILPIPQQSRAQPALLFDQRRWGDLTPLERLQAGMRQQPSFLVPPHVVDEDVAMDED